MTDLTQQWNSAELAELRKVFFAQAAEIVDELQDGLLKLEADAGDDETWKAVKRHIHTLKGDSNSIGLTAIGKLCHRMEDVLAPVMNGSDPSGHEAVELLIECGDAIRRLLTEAEGGVEPGEPADIFSLIDRHLHKQPEETHLPQAPLTEYEELLVGEARGLGIPLLDVEVRFHPECGEKSVAAMMVAARLEGLGQIIRAVPSLENGDFNQGDRFQVLLASKRSTEEIKRECLITAITTEARVQSHGPRSAAGAPKRQADADSSAAATRKETLRVEASKVDRIMDLIGELIIGRSMVEQITRELAAGAAQDEVTARLFSVNAYLERTVSDLQKGAMKMRMVPVHQVFRKFPKIVRDQAVATGKLVRLDLVGAETELDKGIIDALGEPLAHIMRNAVDHGIETPDARRAAGKPEEGVITLRAYHESSLIVIEASDDGRGIDPEQLKRKAVENGYLAAEEAAKMSPEDARNLLFLSGLSTAGAITDTSGRGVGMDAVKAAIENLKGVVEIASEKGKGTTFRLRLPLTLAVIKALLFEVGTRLYAVPVSSISEVAKVAEEDIRFVDGRRTMMLRDQTISLIALDELFRVEGAKTAKKFVLILSMGARKVGLLIDRLIRQQELVVKAVDEMHARSGLLTGASILGNGKVVLIVDASAIWKKAVEEERRRLTTA